MKMTRKQRRILMHWKKGQRIEYRLKFRAALVLGVIQEGKPIMQVAREQGTTPKTVRKWVARYRKQGEKGLHDLPRRGAPATFGVQQRCEVVALACDSPKGYGYTTYNVWTLDLLTEAAVEHTTGPVMSRSSIHRTLQRNDLQPHRHQMWLHSRDPHFREKVNTIVDHYLHPPQGAVVVCVDEKIGMQALERKAPTRPARPGQTARFEHEYIRHGTRSLFAAFNIRTGQVTAQCEKGGKPRICWRLWTIWRRYTQGNELPLSGTT